jgi:hypothetical protein
MRSSLLHVKPLQGLLDSSAHYTIGIARLTTGVHAYTRIPMLLRMHEKLRCAGGGLRICAEEGAASYRCNCPQSEAAGVLGGSGHAPGLRRSTLGVLPLVLLFVEYCLDPLLPAGAIDLCGDHQSFAVWGETPHTSAFSRDVFQQYPPGTV